LSIDKPRFLPCGDCAVTVEFGNEISPKLNNLALGLDAAIRDAALPGVIETVPPRPVRPPRDHARRDRGAGRKDFGNAPNNCSDTPPLEGAGGIWRRIWH